MKPLRTCTKCGLQAHTEEALELFKKATASKYGRNNICKKCDTKRSMSYRTPEEHRRMEKEGRDKK